MLRPASVPPQKGGGMAWHRSRAAPTARSGTPSGTGPAPREVGPALSRLLERLGGFLDALLDIVRVHHGDERGVGVDPMKEGLHDHRESAPRFGGRTHTRPCVVRSQERSKPPPASNVPWPPSEPCPGSEFSTTFYLRRHCRASIMTRCLHQLFLVQNEHSRQILLPNTSSSSRRSDEG